MKIDRDTLTVLQKAIIHSPAEVVSRAIQTGEVDFQSGMKRLFLLKTQTAAVGAEMAEQRGRYEALNHKTAAPRIVTAFNLFQTPADIAKRMAALLIPVLKPDSIVLEPSAGLGRLYQAIRAAGHEGGMILAEQSGECCRELYDLTRDDLRATLKQGDFLGMVFEVDAVIMNPPFKQGLDIKHITHAQKMLKPGGVLVALCSNGPRQNKILKPLATTWEVLPEGSFKSEGTGVSVVMLTIRQ